MSSRRSKREKSLSGPESAVDGDKGMYISKKKVYCNLKTSEIGTKLGYKFLEARSPNIPIRACNQDSPPYPHFLYPS